MENEIIEKPQMEVIEQMADLLKVASDFTRLHILYSLAGGDRCVGDIALDVGCSQSLVSHQLAVLRKWKLVKCEKIANRVVYSLDDYHIVDLLKLVEDHIKESD
ncbi:MAG: helix-turn-helix transcriptional regulator [Bacilli bacterium]|nr:helix-turn-helix transcriptional regulator [Bacilli bacterium]